MSVRSVGSQPRSDEAPNAPNASNGLELGQEPPRRGDPCVDPDATEGLHTSLEAELLATAADTKGRERSSAQCDAWYFAAEARLAAGQKENAAKLFQKCLSLKLSSFHDLQQFCQQRLADKEVK